MGTGSASHVSPDEQDTRVPTSGSESRRPAAISNGPVKQTMDGSPASWGVGVAKAVCATARVATARMALLNMMKLE